MARGQSDKNLLFGTRSSRKISALEQKQVLEEALIAKASKQIALGNYDLLADFDKHLLAKLSKAYSKQRHQEVSEAVFSNGHEFGERAKLDFAKDFRENVEVWLPTASGEQIVKGASSKWWPADNDYSPFYAGILLDDDHDSKTLSRGEVLQIAIKTYQHMETGPSRRSFMFSIHKAIKRLADNPKAYPEVNWTPGSVWHSPEQLNSNIKQMQTLKTLGFEVGTITLSDISLDIGDVDSVEDLFSKVQTHWAKTTQTGLMLKISLLDQFGDQKVLEAVPKDHQDLLSIQDKKIYYAGVARTFVAGVEQAEDLDRLLAESISENWI